MTLPPPNHKRSVTDLDQPDGDSQLFNINKHDTKKTKTLQRTASNKINNNNNSSSTKIDEKHSINGDPIYHTISSEKGKSLARNCISLENLRTLTIKNDLNSYGNNLLQNYHSGQMASGYYILPSFPPPPPTTGYHHYFSHKPAQYMYGPPIPSAMASHPHQQQYFQQNYRMPFTNHGGYANPNPYLTLSNTNSRQSIGNESDDYRKYRDVAL